MLYYDFDFLSTFLHIFSLRRHHIKGFLKDFTLS